MTDWIQYHSSDVMGYGIEDVESPFEVLSSKAIVPTDGAIIWLVGRRAATDLKVYLGGWMRVDGVRTSSHPAFSYEYFGQTGIACDPLPAISDQPWYPQMLKLTGDFRFGLTQLTKPELVTALRALSEEYGPSKRAKTARKSKR